jgi:hypothetical protein
MVKRLGEIGYPEAVNLKGSIFKWANEGRPVFQDSQTVRRVDPYEEMGRNYFFKPDQKKPSF